jgi:hypothetical protein
LTSAFHAACSRAATSTSNVTSTGKIIAPPCDDRSKMAYAALQSARHRGADH